MRKKGGLTGWGFRPVSYPLLLLTAALICLPPPRVAASTLKQAGIALSECEGMKIGILPLNDLAEAAGVPQCSLDVVHVKSDNGIVYTTATKLVDSVPHNMGTHSAPWYLAGAIRSSKYYTTDLSEADIILVDDYCQYINWLAIVHSMHYKGVVHFGAGPGDTLLALYQELLAHPLWQKSGGSNFALYDSHPGFWQGQASRTIAGMKCNEWQKAIQLIEDVPMRFVCKDFWDIKKIMVTPYVPNPLGGDLDPRAYLHLPLRRLADRTTFAYARFTCWPPLWHLPNAGKLFRYVFGTQEWVDSPEMDVRCTDKNATHRLSDIGVISYEEMFTKMRSTIFCPVFPGDSASTRRLSEIFLAGCIPVFLGPPYHSMPFAETVPYNALGIFINISDSRPWMQEVTPAYRLDVEQRASHPSDAKWWVPDADVYDSMIQVETAADILPRLKAFPAEVLEHKLWLMHEYGTRFTFIQRLTQPPSAANSLIAGMCIKQRQNPMSHSLEHAAQSTAQSP